ncbi:sugar phosphate isomerase/epimerase [Vagococcus sp. BWB3-3]|uniref:Sugar phosphate isomerase/epimerase n=1 Tax=Vagococcus allomyrinae TaxID=2794353 RepID=A0A940PFL1_9ENTE|nr:sugar phosphate isomerase/epimerase [Vagococcus allomyrinae]MBP1043960.1 sugar phosphate isomerase/epimerase [Vagococcus allomyrinae]
MTIPFNLGIRAHDLGQLPLDQLMARIKDYEFTNIQFAITKSFPASAPDLQGLSPGTASYYRQAFQQQQINISVLGCYVNIIATDPQERQMALDSFKTHLRLARDFGASLVGTETGSTGHGFTTDNFTEEAFQKVVISVKELVAEAERFGVSIGIEAGLNHPLHSALLAKRLLTEVGSSNLQIILDCANLMSPDNYLRQTEIVEEALDLLGNRIAMIHLKDFTIENQTIKIVPVGHGLLDFKPILAYIKSQRPHLFATLEATTEPELRDSVDYLRKLYQQLEP